MGTGNQVDFDEEGSVISNNETKEVMLKSKRNGDMFTLDINCRCSLDLFTFESFIGYELDVASKTFSLEFQESE